MWSKNWEWAGNEAHSRALCSFLSLAVLSIFREWGLRSFLCDAVSTHKICRSEVCAKRYSVTAMGPVTEILTRRKFWSRGPKFPENLVCRTIIFRKYWSARGIMVRAQILRCKHFNDTSLCQSVCIVSESLKKWFGKPNKLLELLNLCK